MNKKYVRIFHYTTTIFNLFVTFLIAIQTKTVPLAAVSVPPTQEWVLNFHPFGCYPIML